MQINVLESMYDGTHCKIKTFRTLGWKGNNHLKLVSPIFYQIFIFHQMIALQKL